MHEFANGAAEERNRGIYMNVSGPIRGPDLRYEITLDSRVEYGLIVDSDTK